MTRHHVNNFPPGTYVEHVDKDWVGTVKRITINASGEPILVVDIARLDKNGYTVINDTVIVHPANVQRLNEVTVVRNPIDDH